MRELFQGASVSEADTAKTILSTLNETGEVIDPHTAVGVAAANVLRLADPATPVVVLSTAHPAKFPEAVSAAAGVTPATPRAMPDLSKKPEKFDRLPADAETVKAFVRVFAGGQG
jgi:threonine synthase